MLHLVKIESLARFGMLRPETSFVGLVGDSGRPVDSPAHLFFMTCISWVLHPWLIQTRLVIALLKLFQSIHATLRSLFHLLSDPTTGLPLLAACWLEAIWLSDNGDLVGHKNLTAIIHYAGWHRINLNIAPSIALTWVVSRVKAARVAAVRVSTPIHAPLPFWSCLIFSLLFGIFDAFLKLFDLIWRP